MQVDRAEPADIPALSELLTLLFTQEADFRPNPLQQAEGLRRIVDDPAMGQILVLRRGKVLIGMVNLLFTVSTALGGPVAILEDMIVHPAHRGGGAGSLLLRGALDFAREKGCLRVTLLTDLVNEAAQRFYQSHGFSFSEMVPMRRLL